MKKKWSPLPRDKKEALITEFEKFPPVSLDIEVPEDAEAGANQITKRSLLEFLDSPPLAYSLGNGIVLFFLADLFSPYATKNQWVLGRRLANQLAKHYFKPTGRPDEFSDRAFICTHVEWCVEVIEVGLTTALDLTANRFQYSRSKLDRWYIGGKGTASEERKLAKELVVFASSLEWD